MGINIKRGFTLIETIVIISVIGLTLPVIFSIFFVLIQQQIKIYRMSVVKKEGDYLINIIQNTIKDKATIILSSSTPTPPDDTNKVCISDSSSYSSSSGLYFLDKNGVWFGYLINAGSVASNSASFTSVINLTSSKILVNNFFISCSRANMYSPQSVSLSFDICYNSETENCNPSRPEEIALLHYQTKIKLRNY